MYTETNKIHVFDYLSALIKETQYNRVTVSELVSGRIYTKKWGWINFRLDDDHATEKGGCALDVFVNLIADLCWSRETANKKKAKSCLKFKWIKDCGILSRLWVTQRKDGTYKADYCTGQDYDSEMRTIRRLLTEQY
mgnify:FL=1